MASDGLIVDLGRSAYIASPGDGECFTNAVAHLVNYNGEQPTLEYEKTGVAVYDDFHAVASACLVQGTLAHNSDFVEAVAKNLGLGVSYLQDFLSAARIVKSSDYAMKNMQDGLPMFPRFIICPLAMKPGEAHVAVAVRAGDVTRCKITYFKAIKAFLNAKIGDVKDVAFAPAYNRPEINERKRLRKQPLMQRSEDSVKRGRVQKQTAPKARVNPVASERSEFHYSIRKLLSELDIHSLPYKDESDDKFALVCTLFRISKKIPSEFLDFPSLRSQRQMMMAADM